MLLPTSADITEFKAWLNKKFEHHLANQDNQALSKAQHLCYQWLDQHAINGQNIVWKNSFVYALSVEYSTSNGTTSLVLMPSTREGLALSPV